MTQISRDDVTRLASLSALQLDEDEIDTLRRDIEAVMGYVNQLDELDVQNVEPAYQVSGLQNVYRADTVQQSISAEELVKLAPESKDGYIKVPKVL